METGETKQAKRLIMDFIEDEAKLQKLCKNYRLTVGDEYIAGFSEGLRVALKIIITAEVEIRAIPCGDRREQ